MSGPMRRITAGGRVMPVLRYAFARWQIWALAGITGWPKGEPESWQRR